MKSSSASSGMPSRPRQQVFWWLIGLLTLLMLGVTWFAWKQSPHPDPYRMTPKWFSHDFWAYPIEQNNLKRLPLAGRAFNKIAVFGKKIWSISQSGLIIHSEDSGNTWKVQKSKPNTPLISITFIDSNHGWVAGNDGTILSTMDGGKTWQEQVIGTRANLRSIIFVDVNRGWVAGADGAILSTTDGGKTWQEQVSGTRASLKSIIFVDVNRGWVAGADGAILSTTDGGKTWQEQVSGTRESLNSITFVDANRGWVAAYGAILSTTDGGKTWQEQVSRAWVSIESISFVDANRGWAAGTHGVILLTTDGGKTWQKQVSATNRSFNDITSITFVDANRGWVTGAYGEILSTMDGGKTWHEQVSGTRASLNSISFVDANRGWVAGDDGAILSTRDGGITWQSQSETTEEFVSNIALTEGNRGWPSADEDPVYTSISKVAFIDANRGWLVCDLEWVLSTRKVVLFTTDGGKTWQSETTVGGSPNSITLIDSNHGWTAGGGGEILLTTDGGKTWQEQVSGTKASLNTITFVDANRGWVAGADAAILSTTDGGKTWQEQVTGTRASLESITFVDANRGWVAGADGEILSTTDGGKTWQEQVSGMRASLKSITFVDANRGWIAGADGAILSTTDGGKTWQEQVSGTRASLKSITFVDANRGWVAGDDGTILSTTDGGKTWQEITYRIFPAPWFYLALLIALVVYAAAFWWRAWQIREDRKRRITHTITDHVATDKPSGLGDPDFLGARRVAVGLTRFLTNKKTEPPLTLAITGDWGSGKSSLMNYLFANLKREGLKPVWFNAWHHRDEQNVLASILAKVNQEAIKPWWHPAGFWFRGRLWWRRHVLWKLLMLLTLFSLFYAGTWLYQLPKDKWTDTLHYARYLLKIDQPVILSERGFEQLCGGWIESQKAIEVFFVEKNTPATASKPVPKRKPEAVMVDTHKGERHQDPFAALDCEKLQAFSVQKRIKHNALNCVTDIATVARKTCFASPPILLDNIERQLEGMFLLKEETLIKDQLDFLNPDSPVPLPDPLTGGIAALLVALFIFAGKSMALLGLSSMQFVQSVLTRLRGIHQPAEKTGTRMLFEDYFRHVTDLLGKRRLVLFIDDLDRCDRDYTRQVLEVSNFLSNSGALFIVIGMAPRYVLANVTLSFQETAKAVHEADIRNIKPAPGHDPNAGQSWFAQHYLQKLINIEVPVPKPDAEQVKALLKNAQDLAEDISLSKEQKEDKKLEQLEKSEKRINDVLHYLGKIVRLSILLGTIGGAVYLAWPAGADKPGIKTENQPLQSLATEPQQETDGIKQEHDRPEKGLPKPEDESPTSKEDIFVPGYERDTAFVEWPLWAGVSVVVFIMMLGAAVFLLVRKQDELEDPRWLWLKPLLKRLKVTLIGPESTQDTKDFIDALEIWYGLIAQKDPTPRNIKAFKNHLRYLVSRDNQSQETSREAHLVALATLYYAHQKYFEEICSYLIDPNASCDPLSDEFSFKMAREKLSKHKEVFGRLPSQDDIEFYKNMTQDIQIHRPD